eukprot:10558672-Lingulodinium_polyedra.AAC.1
MEPGPHGGRPAHPGTASQTDLEQEHTDWPPPGAVARAAHGHAAAPDLGVAEAFARLSSAAM